MSGMRFPRAFFISLPISKDKTPINCINERDCLSYFLSHWLTWSPLLDYKVGLCNQKVAWSPHIEDSGVPPPLGRSSYTNAEQYIGTTFSLNFPSSIESQNYYDCMIKLEITTWLLLCKASLHEKEANVTQISMGDNAYERSPRGFDYVRTRGDLGAI